jgi:site-specific recombinase XerD
MNAMAEGEMSVLALARLLGHARLQSTQRYIDGADPQLRQAYLAAMARAATTAPPPEPAAAASGPRTETPPATVQRADPPIFDCRHWQPGWPEWLRQGCLAWLQHQWWQWKPSQRLHHAKLRRSQWHRFWDWQLSRRALSGWADLQPADLCAFADAQLARGLKVTSLRSILDGVYAVLHYLVLQGQLAVEPARPALTLPQTLPRHLQPRELLSLESYVAQAQAQADDATWLAIGLYYLLAHGGLRISEVLDLHVRDVDLDSRRVQVRDGKGHRDRSVYLTATAITALRTYLNTVPNAPDDLLFSAQQRPLSYAQALKRVRRLAVAAGVPGVSPIRLRHTYATTLLNNGLTLEALRRLMGHEHLSTTLIYARLADLTVERQYQAAMAQVTT